MKNYILRDRKLSGISKIILILTWIIFSRIVDNEVIVPSVKSTFIGVIEIIKNPKFLNIVIYTLYRTIFGFLVSLILAITIGVLSSISKIVYNLMSPILKLLNGIPTIAIIVLLLIWINNEFVPMFVGFVMVFPILFDTVLNSILNIDKDIIEMAHLYNVSRKRIIKDIYMPNILYNLASISNSVLGVNLKMVIAGEVLSQPRYAIGSSIQMERMYLNTPGVFAWITIILFILAIFDYLLKGLNYLLVKDKGMR